MQLRRIWVIEARLSIARSTPYAEEHETRYSLLCLGLDTFNDYGTRSKKLHIDGSKNTDQQTILFLYVFGIVEA